MAVLGLRFCARTLSGCGKRGPLFIAVRGPLTITSLVAEHRLQTRRLSSCGSRAQLLRGTWDLPRPGLEPASPALAGGFPTTAPPGKPGCSEILKNDVCYSMLQNVSKPSCGAVHTVVICEYFQEREEKQDRGSSGDWRRGFGGCNLLSSCVRRPHRPWAGCGVTSADGDTALGLSARAPFGHRAHEVGGPGPPYLGRTLSSVMPPLTPWRPVGCRANRTTPSPIPPARLMETVSRTRMFTVSVVVAKCWKQPKLILGAGGSLGYRSI